MSPLKIPVQFDFAQAIEQLQRLQEDAVFTRAIPPRVAFAFPGDGISPKYLPGQFVKVRGDCAVVLAVSDDPVDGEYLYDAVTLDGRWHLYTEEDESDLESLRYEDRPKYGVGDIIQVRGVHSLVTAIRPHKRGADRLYDVITLDGSRHLYTGEPECNLNPDRAPTVSGGDT